MGQKRLQLLKEIKDLFSLDNLQQASDWLNEVPKVMTIDKETYDSIFGKIKDMGFHCAKFRASLDESRDYKLNKLLS